MIYSPRDNEQRRDQRVDLKLPIKINIDSQISLQGSLKDLSLKSAFVIMKASVYLQVNDEVGFSIQCAPGKEDDVIKGAARISRVEPGEGFVIYFIRLEYGSEPRLKKIVES